jgi:hypothetical protein
MKIAIYIKRGCIVLTHPLIDEMVCKEFGLELNNLNDSGETDYGHFKLNSKLYCQEYISWWGLIAKILWWGDVHSGDKSMGDILNAYVFDVWKKSIIWPDESVVLVAKLLKFLEKQGLYIKVWWGL